MGYECRRDFPRIYTSYEPTLKTLREFVNALRFGCEQGVTPHRDVHSPVANSRSAFRAATHSHHALNVG